MERSQVARGITALAVTYVCFGFCCESTAGELPYCDDINVSSQQFDAAMDEVMATGQHNDSWTNPAQFVAATKAVEEKLGCRLSKPDSPKSASLQERAKATVSESELRGLYQDPEIRKDKKALEQIALNKQCPPDILRELSTHKEPDVRFCVAGNAKTPGDVLRTFIGQKSVYGALASNPSTPPDALRILSQEDGFTKRSVAANPNTPPDVLKALSEDSFFFVKLGVIDNPSTTRDILQKLNEDSNKSVALAAKRVLQKRFAPSSTILLPVKT